MTTFGFDGTDAFHLAGTLVPPRQATIMRHPFIPKPVSRYFYLDWNAAVRAARFPALQPATSVIALMPLLQEFLPEGIISLDRVWILWWASLFFIGATVLLKVRCPSFIQQYQYFNEFQSQGHSHRWIVWQFFRNLDSLSGWKDVIFETVYKNITLPASTQNDPNVLGACPVFQPAPSRCELGKQTPINLNRDIYMPIWICKQRFVLVLQERDPEIREKIKELFWILSTQAASERPSSRLAFWSLLAVAGVLFAIAFLDNVSKALFGKGLSDYLALFLDWAQSCSGI